MSKKIYGAESRVYRYHDSRQFPFDEVIDEIIHELEKRNWTVPGIDVNFYEGGSGDAKYRIVSAITCTELDCRLKPYTYGSTLNIPQREISVYDDESGPSYYVYTGDDWGRDREAFMGIKVHSKMRGKPRTYLCYTGSWKSLYSYRNQRPPFLVADNNLGREYLPEGNETHVYETEAVFAEFTMWLRENLLAKIIAHPLPLEQIDIFARSPLPFPDGLPPIFCKTEYDDIERIAKGQESLDSLPRKDRYGLIGSPRLVPLGDGPREGEAPIPEIAFDGFLWCSFTRVKEYLGYYLSYEKYTVRILPKSADGVYIADNKPFNDVRKHFWAEAAKEDPPRDRLNDREFRQALCARGRTIIPITEYAGDFAEPIVLINRELGLDEVELTPECVSPVMPPE